ncbi:MAG TPA: hypothetical protein VFW98_08385 [Gemmatimonadaceae bacterium]|nr:hypothetical protein [Gemmatimonadaceae bacterium]
MTAMSKPVSREVIIDGRVYVATFAHAGVTLREKGKRTTYGPVSWGRILLDGARMMADEAIQERHARRKVSRGLLRR